MKKSLLTPLTIIGLTIAGSFTTSNWSSKAQDIAEEIELQSAPAETGYYGIAFYNLENLFDTINNNGKYDLEFSPKGDREWNSHKYWEKINKMSFTISQMTDPRTPKGPAIIGISEVENESVVKDLVNAGPLKDRKLKYIHHDSPDSRGIDVAMLYDPEMFRVLSVTNTPLTEVKFPTRDQMAVTGVLGGLDTMTVIVCHWPSRLGGQDKSEPNRIAAGKLAHHIADSLWKVNPRQHVIVMGDLNDDPNNTSVAALPGLGAVYSPKKVKEHGFYNPWYDIWEEDYRGTLNYKDHWNLFDQIIVSGTLIDQKKRQGTGKLVYSDAQINDFEFLKNKPGTPYGGKPHRTYASKRWLNGYSDHFPTEIFLKVREN